MIVMLAISCFELTHRVLFVLICVGSGIPARSHTATIPSTNPVPFTFTSSVVDSAPLSGDTDATLTEVVAVFPNCAALGAATETGDESLPAHAHNVAAAAQMTIRAEREWRNENIVVFVVRVSEGGKAAGTSRASSRPLLSLHGHARSVLRRKRSSIPAEDVRGPVVG